MPAGYNQLARIIDIDYLPDDSIGGSVPTGTMIYDNLLVLVDPLKPTTALLEQGIETVKLFETAVSARASNIKENNQLIIYAPEESPYFNQTFRVVAVRHPSMRPNDPRSQIIITLKRFEDAHSNQY